MDMEELELDDLEQFMKSRNEMISDFEARIQDIQNGLSTGRVIRHGRSEKTPDNEYLIKGYDPVSKKVFVQECGSRSDFGQILDCSHLMFGCWEFVPDPE